MLMKTNASQRNEIADDPFVISLSLSLCRVPLPADERNSERERERLSRSSAIGSLFSPLVPDTDVYLLIGMHHHQLSHPIIVESGESVLNVMESGEKSRVHFSQRKRERERKRLEREFILVVDTRHANETNA